MRNSFFAVLLVSFGHQSLSADALKSLLKGSEDVASCVILAEPFGFRSEAGIVSYDCELRVLATGMGHLKKGDKIRVHVVRAVKNMEDVPGYLRKNGKCILFLRKSSGQGRDGYETFDPLFGSMPNYPSLLQRVMHLTKEH